MTVTAAYLNGRWVSEAELVIPAGDAGFVWGATVSERLRTFRGDVFRLDDHLTRLSRSLDVVGLDVTAICGEVAHIVPQVAHRGRNGLDEADDLGIVVLVTPPAGSSATAYGTLAVSAAPLDFGDWAAKYQLGERLVLSSHRQVPPSCWPSELKCRSRMHYYLADLEARRMDPGARAILLDQDGRLAEASTANLLLVRRGVTCSPRLDSILPGVSLAYVEQLAAAVGIPFEYVDLKPCDLEVADEVLLASTSPCVLPACRHVGKPIGDGRPGPIFHRLIDAWGRTVGVDIVRQAERFARR